MIKDTTTDQGENLLLRPDEAGAYLVWLVIAPVHRIVLFFFSTFLKFYFIVGIQHSMKSTLKQILKYTTVVFII